MPDIRYTAIGYKIKKLFKAGKMWRITREDLEGFLGRPVPWE